MITLLIVADDFTGALDTGVQFAAAGAATRVVTDSSYDLRHLDPSIQVLVMDAETRHLSSRAAYEIVYAITKRALDLGVPHIYKKTDSALRGNIGSELSAVLHASGSLNLPFFPAFPKMHRCVKAGVLYIDGIPVDKSVFGRDPFEPVDCSHIPDLIRRQSSVPISVRTPEEAEFLTDIPAYAGRLSSPKAQRTPDQRWMRRLCRRALQAFPADGNAAKEASLCSELPHHLRKRKPDYRPSIGRRGEERLRADTADAAFLGECQGKCPAGAVVQPVKAASLCYFRQQRSAGQDLHPPIRGQLFDPLGCAADQDPRFLRPDPKRPHGKRPEHHPDDYRRGHPARMHEAAESI